MARTRTTTSSCDYVYPDGRHCDKVFQLPDLPAEPTPGNENIVSISDIETAGGQPFFFCDYAHAAGFCVVRAKERAAAKTQKSQASSAPAVRIPTKSELARLQALGMVEPDDLNLREN